MQPTIHVHIYHPLDPVQTAAIFESAKATTAPAEGIRVREVDGGAVLDVKPEVQKLLIDFGWMPPVDGE